LIYANKDIHAISVISVLVFTGLTAFDSQRLKDVFNLYIAGNNKMLKKVGIIGALTLYMDFINIFIHLLQLLGTRRDK
jgi:FtsH-binding integral membrane protein